MVVKDTVADFGRINILFNKTGVNRSQPMDKTTDEDVYALMDIDAKGHFGMMRVVVD